MRRMKRESGGLCRSAMEQGSLFYPAVLEENGTVMTENGAYVYQKGNPVDTWTADDLSFYGTELSQAYEAMFREYGEDFERFSWKVYDGKRTGTGERTESRSTGNGGNGHPALGAFRTEAVCG